RATLETLGERLFSGELKDAAAELPREIAHYLTRATASQRLSLDDFYHRVATREPCDLPDAVYHARVVVSVLEAAISTGKIRAIRAQLPAECRDLFAHHEFIATSPVARAPGRDHL